MLESSGAAEAGGSDDAGSSATGSAMIRDMLAVSNSVVNAPPTKELTMPKIPLTILGSTSKNSCVLRNSSRLA